MQKSFTKYLSAILALVLILSVLPMAAFAAEQDGHVHEGECLSAYTPAAAGLICPDGRHLLAYTTKNVYTDCGSTVHRVDVYNYIVCGNCSYSVTGDLISSTYEAHTYTKTQVGTDPDSGLPIYLYACRCGNSYYAN